MNTDREPSPFEGVSTSEDVLVQDPQKRLRELVDNDPDAPLLASVPQDASLAFFFQELVGFAGRFPSEVAFFAIAVAGCVAIACFAPTGDDFQSENLPAMGLILGSALAAQVIYGKSKQG